METFGEKTDLKDNLNISGNNKNIISSKIKFFLIFIFILLVLSIGFLIFVLLNDNYESEFSQNIEPLEPEKKKTNNFTISGEINCIYFINDIKSNTSLLSKDFENINNTIINIYINNKMKNTKEYQFPISGYYDIKFILNSEIIMDNMFKDIKNIISIESIIIYYNSSIKILSMKSVFEGCSNLNKISINSTFDTSELKSATKLFYNSGISFINITNLNMENIEDISYMFAFSNINNIDFLNDLNIKNIKNISGLFKGCIFLENIDMSIFNCKKIEDISYLFEKCEALKKVNFENFNADKINNMSCLFRNCTKLKEIKFDKLSTKYVKDFSNMFYNCISLKELNLSGFDTKEATNFYGMFQNCFSLTSIILSSFNTKNVYYFSKCFIIVKI